MAILTMSAGAGICLTMVCILNVYIYIYIQSLMYVHVYKMLIICFGRPKNFMPFSLKEKLVQFVIIHHVDSVEKHLFRSCRFR